MGTKGQKGMKGVDGSHGPPGPEVGTQPTWAVTQYILEYYFSQCSFTFLFLISCRVMLGLKACVEIRGK